MSSEEYSERDIPEGMTRVYVFRRSTQLFWYDAFYVPGKGDRVYSAQTGELKVKYAMFYKTSPDIAEVYVK